MRAFTSPMIVADLGTPSQVCLALENVALRPRGSGASYDEAWLQRLIQDHPSLLPISEIEPGLAQPVPVCLELPVPSGYIDNLMVTTSGGLVVVETKLWRNPEARREVIGQVLDYAKDLSGFTYDDLERAIRTARKEPAARLFNLVNPDGRPEDEPGFIDAVSRNLRLGRMLLIIAGDGIQEGAEQLAGFLQRHVGLHFTLGLVEMSLWRDPRGGEVYVQPRVLARTVQIERAIIRVEGSASLTTPTIEAMSPSRSKPTSLTVETFFESLASADPALPSQIRSLLADLEPLGIVADVKRNLSLKWHGPDDAEFHLGVIDLEGRLVTDYANWSADGIGRLDLAHDYQAKLAALVPGGQVRQTPKPSGWRVVDAQGRSPLVAVLLGRKDAWLGTMADYAAKLADVLKDQS